MRKENRILYIVVGVLLISQLWNWFKPTEQPDFSNYKEKYMEIQKDIDSLYQDLNESKAEIIYFKTKMNEIDTLYSIADKSTLRDRANIILRR